MTSLRKFEAYFLLILIFFQCHTPYFIKIPSLEANSVATCLNMIIKNSFKAQSTLIMVDTKLHIYYPAVNIKKIDKYLKFSEDNFPVMYVISITNETFIAKIFDFLQENQIFNPRAKMLFILSNSSLFDMVFEFFKQYFISNVVIIDTNENLATYDPYIYGNAMATGIQPIRLGKCSNFNFSSWKLWKKTFPFYWRNTTVSAIYSEHFPYLYQAEGELNGENFRLISTLKEKLLFRLTTRDCGNISMTGLYFSKLWKNRENFDTFL